MLLFVIMVTATPINSVESANSTQTDMDAIVENKPMERTVRMMYNKRRLAGMDKETDEKKHREGFPMKVIWIKQMAPSRYTPDPASKWDSRHFCPQGTFVKKMNLWQDDKWPDQKGLTSIELYCAGTPGAQETAKWIKSGLVGSDRGTQVSTIECPDSEWVTAAKTVFEDSSTGAIRFYISCRKPSDPFPFDYYYEQPEGFWRTNTISTFKPEETRSAEEFSQLCNRDQAICGFSTYTRENTAFNDCSGINQVEIFCCPFPQGYLGLGQHRFVGPFGPNVRPTKNP